MNDKILDDENKFEIIIKERIIYYTAIVISCINKIYLISQNTFNKCVEIF